jgi:hypothetical protein
MNAGQVAEACGKFGESQRIDPKPGTLLNLALCHEKEGRTATAWAEFTQAAVQARYARQEERMSFALRHAASLEPQLSRIVVTWDEPEMGQSIRLDGAELGSGTVGTKLPIDPGDHTIESMAPGKRTWQGTLHVEQGPAEQQLHIPKLIDETESATRVDPSPLPPPAAPNPIPTPVPVAPRPESDRPRTAAWIVSGVGLAAMATGTFFGLRAFSLKHEAQGACDGSACSHYGLELYDDVDRAATASTVAFSLGILTTGVGIYMLVREDPRPPAAVTTPVSLRRRDTYAAIRYAW